MALILCLETATEVCSVALFREDTLLGLKESSERNVHSAMLTVFIEALFSEAGLDLAGLDAVAVSMGPGSYTGLRIGVATAKGLCYSLGIPLISVPTLQSMANGMTQALPLPSTPDRGVTGREVLLCPMIDARRMEVYCALYDGEGNELREVRAEIIDENSFAGMFGNNRIIFGGEGAGKCRDVLGAQPNAVFLDGFKASARDMKDLAAAKFEKQAFENLAYFEPFYLKDFIAGKPRVKGLH